MWRAPPGVPHRHSCRCLLSLRRPNVDKIVDVARREARATTEKIMFVVSDARHELFLDLHQTHQLHWIIALPPRVEAAFERAHSGDAVFLELQRRTGAGGFVGSSAVEDHIAIPGDLQMPFLQLLAVEPDGAGYFRAVRLILFGSAQVQDHYVVELQL